MPQQQQGQESPPAGGGAREHLNVVVNVSQVVAAPIAPWATRLGTWGQNYLTAPAVAGCLLWPPVFAAFYGPHPRLGDVYDFWAVTVLLVFVHQAAGVQQRRKGYRCHSRYCGDSWLEGGSRGLPQRAARLADGLLAVGAGFIAADLGSAPLGSLLMLGGTAKLLGDVLAFQAAEARVRQMEDARAESEYYAGVFRERQR